MNYVLPGMGATHEMYSEPWRSLKNTTFLNWPSKSQSTSIPDLAAELIDLHNIQGEDSMIGTSLGGMVACEIANQIRVDRLVLIGSAIHQNEISTLLRSLAPLVGLTPFEFIQNGAGKVDSQLTDMFTQSDPQFIRNMCKATINWDGLRSERIPFRIHGIHDQVIPIPRKVDVRIDGGHLIVMTHAEECVQAISSLFL